jgi:inner membrane protein involved in colicin E2 resistance
MPFYTAYLIAAAAVTVMMTLYSRALLIGSIGTFVIVALVMFLTRKLDWYNNAEDYYPDLAASVERPRTTGVER